MVLGRECPVQAWVHYQVSTTNGRPLYARWVIEQPRQDLNFGRVRIINKWCKFVTMLTFYIEGAPIVLTIA